MSTPIPNKPDDDLPLTNYERQKRADANPEPGEGEISQSWPRLPASNPWAQPMAPEPMIDRTCDGVATNERIDDQ